MAAWTGNDPNKCVHKFIGDSGFRRTQCGMTQFSVIKSPERLEGCICPKCWKPITFVGILDEQLIGEKREENRHGCIQYYCNTLFDDSRSTYWG